MAEGNGDDRRLAALLRTFVPDGRLIRLPAKRGRRRLVLEYLAQAFEPGRRFPEREVDAVLRAFCAGGEVDHVTVRRYLVDEGLLSRDHGLYWRSGGWVDVFGEPQHELANADLVRRSRATDTKYPTESDAGPRSVTPSTQRG